MGNARSVTHEANVRPYIEYISARRGEAIEGNPSCGPPSPKKKASGGTTNIIAATIAPS